MNLILIAAVLGGLLAYYIYHSAPSKTEKTTKIGVNIWRLLWIPVYMLIMYSVIQSGGMIGFGAAFLATLLLVILILVFQPHKNIKQYRSQI